MPQTKLASLQERLVLHYAGDGTEQPTPLDRVAPRPPEDLLGPAVTGSIAVVARLAIAVVFLWSGVGKLLGPAGTIGYMQQSGVPFAAVLVWVAVAVELGGGFALVLGWQTRLAAAALAVFALVAAAIFHPFWATDTAHALDAEIHFLKDVAIFGGLLMLVAHGAGRYSLDARRAGGPQGSAATASGV